MGDGTPKVNATDCGKSAKMPPLEGVRTGAALRFPLGLQHFAPRPRQPEDSAFVGALFRRQTDAPIAVARPRASEGQSEQQRMWTLAGPLAADCSQMCVRHLGLRSRRDRRSNSLSVDVPRCVTEDWHNDDQADEKRGQ
jgi:hypothetical protein